MIFSLSLSALYYYSLSIITTNPYWALAFAALLVGIIFAIQRWRWQRRRPRRRQRGVARFEDVPIEPWELEMKRYQYRILYQSNLEYLFDNDFCKAFEKLKISTDSPSSNEVDDDMDDLITGMGCLSGWPVCAATCRHLLDIYSHYDGGDGVDPYPSFTPSSMSGPYDVKLLAKTL
ncbi:hypothetical protein BC941DRAFT_518333 [Chlamydoabsidia padenii]|nr:hypothetical protein BC941DRAFT_518333 [Chlamydoabsidia padenii]